MTSILAVIGPEAAFARGEALPAERAPERSGVGGQGLGRTGPVGAAA